MIRALKLITLGITTSLKELMTYLQNLYHYRHCPHYLAIEYALFREYLFNNPYRLCKRYFKQLKVTEQPYGETPLNQIEAVFNAIPLQADDCFIDAGAGRGKLALWVAARYGCRVKGIEINPAFIHFGYKIVDRCQLAHQVSFALCDFSTANLSEATVIYLYGIAFDDDTMAQIAFQLSQLSPSTKIITVSDPLNEFCETAQFETTATFTCTFTWGKTTLYMQTPLPK